MQYRNYVLGILLFMKIGTAYASKDQMPYLTGTNMNPSYSTKAINALNIKCYNARADYWDRMPFASFLPAEILLKHNPTAGMHALDIGSGTGMLAEWLVKQGFAVTCIDPAEEMVMRCKAKGLDIVQTTIQEFSCDKKFGLIIAVLSLIHVPKCEISTQLKHISEWLNPSGTFVLALIAGNGEGVGEKNSGYPRYFSYYTRQEVLDLTQSDFNCLFERCIDANTSIPYMIFIFQKKELKQKDAI